MSEEEREESEPPRLPISQIMLKDFLSYGPGEYTFDLKALNVLIGPNGSGKTNLIEAFEVLRAVPKDVLRPFRRGGGFGRWVFNGASGEAVPALGLLTAGGTSSLRYHIELTESEWGSAQVRSESVLPGQPYSTPDEFFLERELYGPARIMGRGWGGDNERDVKVDDATSVLAQVKDEMAYPQLARISRLMESIQIFRSWALGPNAPTRGACPSDVRQDRLEEDFSNLPMRLQALRRMPALKRRLQALLSDLAPGFDDFEVFPEGGTLHLYLTEGDNNISAQRLSDGTLRYLCLLAILLDPPEGGVIIIEEPELGLHPDMLGTLRDLLVEASETAQIIITTHSTMLVDAFTEHPEAIVVCEKPEGSTELRRLTREEVDAWREFGSLGQLWISGQFGGTRW